MCCGRQRQQYRATSGGATGPARPRAARRQTVVQFQYVGATALTVVGSGTGARYRFEGRGSVVRVDPRDRRSLAAVPMLREIG